MLKTRVVTALVLLAILLPIMYSASFLAFSLVATIFLGAAMWESQRLFRKPLPVLMALAWAGLFIYLAFYQVSLSTPILFSVCVLFWVVKMVPALAIGLPALSGLSNGFLSGIYGVAIFGCFMAMSTLFLHSPLFLLSVLLIVWVADIGAYFSGKAFGRRKLAPSISPGKSWEGALGGWIAVLLISALSTSAAVFSDTFPAKVLAASGWLGFILVMSLLTAASVVGDLFESLLKRRASMKDSSSLLPGHGGVLDRIDALIPVLPIAALLDYLL
jgi:phosphatidate cytidylyltransferase